MDTRVLLEDLKSCWRPSFAAAGYLTAFCAISSTDVLSSRQEPLVDLILGTELRSSLLCSEHLANRAIPLPGITD